MLWAPGTARPSVPMNGPLGKLGAAREQVFSRMRGPSSVQGREGPAMSLASKKSGQSAVVTGAGSGLGRDIALALAAKGYIVFGTAFAAAEVQDLKQASGGRVSLTVCDITKDQAVRAWAASVSDALGAWPHRADQHLDRQPSAPFQRALGRIQGCDGSLRGRLSGRIETLRNRRRRAGGRQYENGRPGEDGNGAGAHGRADDSARARSLRTGVRHVRCETQQHAGERARLRRGRGARDRAGRAEPSAALCCGWPGCRRDSSRCARAIGCGKGCSPPPNRRVELDPLLHQRRSTERTMIETVDTADSSAVRNKNNVLALYDLMINQKRSEEATAKFVSPSYIQHNPIIPDGSLALGQFFGKVTRARLRARVVVHKIIAVGDYVWAHLNFLNLFTDDPNDTGIAGVDIYRMNAEGKAVEHWDTLQLVGDPKNSAPLLGPNIPRANPNGMF